MTAHTSRPTTYTSIAPTRALAIREARQLIETGLELISSEERWTKLTYARDSRGGKVAPGSEQPKPVAWCLLGCIWEAEYRFAVSKSRRQPLAMSAVVWPQSLRLTVALTAAWVGCEHAFYGAAGEGSTLEDALAFEVGYRDSLPGQIGLLNDRPTTSHRDVCRALEIASQLLSELDGGIGTPSLRAEPRSERN
jgi:hypothetical protein